MVPGGTASVSTRIAFSSTVAFVGDGSIRVAISYGAQERQESYLLQGQLSVLTLISVSVPP